MTLFLVRYGEIGLKSSPVRNRFERILISNISRMFAKAGVECIFNTDWGHVYIETSTPKKAFDLLKNVFGIVSFSDVIACSSEMEKIRRVTVDYSKDVLKRGDSFALNVRRKGIHPFTSIQLAVAAGGDVLRTNASKGVRVDLTNPDKEIFVEVRDKRAYIYRRKIQGLGGLPLGSQGNVLVLVEDMRSIVSAFLMMKRGCKVFLLPRGKAKKESLRRWIEKLNKFDPDLIVLPQPQTDELNVIKSISKEWNIDALTLGSSIESIDLSDIFTQTNLPILYPLIGLDCKMIERLKRRICAEN